MTTDEFIDGYHKICNYLISKEEEVEKQINWARSTSTMSALADMERIEKAPYGWCFTEAFKWRHHIIDIFRFFCVMYAVDRQPQEMSVFRSQEDGRLKITFGIGWTFDVGLLQKVDFANILGIVRGPVEMPVLDEIQKSKFKKVFNLLNTYLVGMNTKARLIKVPAENEYKTDRKKFVDVIMHLCSCRRRVSRLLAKGCDDRDIIRVMAPQFYRTYIKYAHVAFGKRMEEVDLLAGYRDDIQILD